MLYPTAGSRFYIAEDPFYAGDAVSESDWVEIGETEALGILGVVWDLEDVTALSCDGGPQVEEVVKGTMRRPPMQIILGNDPTDAGQIMLWRASRSEDPFSFRLVFSDGGMRRSWSALVISLSEVFDVANGVMKLQADLKPTSEIRRSEAP